MVMLNPSNRRTNARGVVLDPRTLLQADANTIDFEVLSALAGRSLLSVAQIDRRTLFELCKFAALLELSEIASHRPLAGKLIITAFFEPSTRTRLSFESAAARLDARVLSVPDGKVTGVAKGESLADIGEMFNTYGDLVIMRHPQTEALAELGRNLVLPLINAGNGSGEHPSQAILDWYCLLKWRPELMRELPAGERLQLGIIGTPTRMRAVRSFLLLSLCFPGAIDRITLLSESEAALDGPLRQAIAASEIPVELRHDPAELVPQLDVIYMNSIALADERGSGYRELDQRFRLDAGSPLRPGAVILHPLARKQELDTSLDESAHNLYFAQAAGAVFIRQALLIGLLGLIDRVPVAVQYLAAPSTAAPSTGV